MSKTFYSENEENTFDSLNNFEYLLKVYSTKPPSLEDALIELFRNGGASLNKAKEIYDHLFIICIERVNRKRSSLIKQENEDISKKDALIISSHTYEAKQMYNYYRPYIKKS